MLQQINKKKASIKFIFIEGNIQNIQTGRSIIYVK